MTFFSSRELRDRYRITSTGTLKNWGKRERNPFPEPAKLMAGRLYWLASDVLTWEKAVTKDPGRSPITIIEAQESDGSMIGATEFCRMLGIHRRTLGHWLSNPRMGFPSSRIIRYRHYWRRAEIEKWLAGHQSAMTTSG